MLFNSVEFTVFLPIVFFIYWIVPSKNIRIQNGILLGASYFFYGWWDWRFLTLIIFSSFLDFFLGHKISGEQNEKKRKLYLWISLGFNLGLLGFFKYFNFFAESFADAYTLLGGSFDPVRLGIILPVGISFYTFQTLSYSIDIYRGKLQPTKDIVGFFAFVSFFPQLVAGPIERAQNLLPQFQFKRKFHYSSAVDGLRQILWGLLKKVVIADNCAMFVNEIFANEATYSGSTLLLGAILFAFQIYGDFSGYSDIAIGTAKLFGFSLMKNFNFPYFSRDIAEFWRRWHISLSTWFRDYLYIPLGGSRGGTAMRVRNTFIIFLVSGFWHGANWTFIVWGGLNALFFLPLLYLGQNRNHMGDIAPDQFFPGIKEFLLILFTFLLTTLAWVFFRAASVTHAITYLKGIFSTSLFSAPEIFPLSLVILISLFLTVEWIFRNKDYGLDFSNTNLNSPIKWSIYIVVIFIICHYGASQQDFIYFQF
ncbi:MAG: MBOAT family O-acyltransferase [Bacteroidota bacterium]